jgi:hypothetical protein
VTEYNANGSITGWLSKPVSNNNSKKIFEPMKFIGYIDDDTPSCDKTSMIIIIVINVEDGFLEVA